MNEQINFVAAIIIIKHVLPRFILFCFVVFPFSGSDDSLSELPINGLKVRTIFKKVFKLETN